MADPLATVPSGRAADAGPVASIQFAQAARQTPAVQTQTLGAVSAFDQSGPSNALASGTQRALLSAQEVGSFNPIASLDSTRQAVQRSFNPIQQQVESSSQLTTISAQDRNATERFVGESNFNSARLQQEVLPLQQIENQSAFQPIALGPQFQNGEQRTAIPGPPFQSSGSANAVTSFQFVRSNTGSVLDTTL